MFYFTSNYTPEKSKEFLTFAGMIDFISWMEPNQSMHNLFCGESKIIDIYKSKDNELWTVTKDGNRHRFIV